MDEQYNIKDESGDKKYFTQIPNIIVNHSTAYEQSLYLVMKRLAGEHGSCFASLNWLSKKMGVDKKTVTKNITKLLDRKWIKEVEGKSVKGGVVRQFVIVDLWKINIKEYVSGSQVPTKRSGSIIPVSGSIIPVSGRQTDTKKNYTNNNTKNLQNKKVLRKKSSLEGKDLNELIELFSTINPTYERLFSNKTERASLERMVKKFGKDWITRLIEALPRIISQPYSPRITTPYQLERKMGELKSFIEQQKLIRTSKGKEMFNLIK